MLERICGLVFVKGTHPCVKAPRKKTLRQHFVDHFSEQVQNYRLTVDPSDIAVLKHTDTDSGVSTLGVEVDYTTRADLLYFSLPIHRRITVVTRY